MPRVKIDYIVSFSNEDPENPASNLLKWDISKRKWLCGKGEPSCSVVLQLAKAVQIQSVHIGAHHTAVVEVLVGLSEKPNDPFEVLVPSCVLVSASESRSSSGLERVRTFSGEQLTTARSRRFDRLRVVCSQPYNKHCQYGLSFVHVFSPEADAEPKPLFPLSSERYSDDEETFHPGELFAKHHPTSPATATDAQIRRASARALDGEAAEANGARLRRVGLSRDAPDGPRPSGPGRREKRQAADAPDASQTKRKAPGRKDSPKRDADSDGEGFTRYPSESATSRSAVCAPGAGARGGALRGVVFALSGYQNPRRARLRAAALAMGARYRPDYSPACTHLVCAFAGTPKLRAVRAAGAACVAVRGEWLEACARAGRRLPWRPFAVERRPPASPPPESDTDDEVERVRAAATRPASPARAPRDRRLLPAQLLGDFLDGWRCALCERLAGARRASLSRYLAAYGALVVRPAEAQLVLCAGGHAHDAPALRPAWLAAAHSLRRAPDPAPFLFSE